MNSSDSTNRRFSKVQLANMFSISKRTVIRTMLAAKIPTSRCWHGDEDVRIFSFARELINKGCTYRQVQQWFTIKEIKQL